MYPMSPDPWGSSSSLDFVDFSRNPNIRLQLPSSMVPSATNSFNTAIENAKGVNADLERLEALLAERNRRLQLSPSTPARSVTPVSGGSIPVASNPVVMNTPSFSDSVNAWIQSNPSTSLDDFSATVNRSLTATPPKYSMQKLKVSPSAVLTKARNLAGSSLGRNGLNLAKGGATLGIGVLGSIAGDKLTEAIYGDTATDSYQGLQNMAAGGLGGWGGALLGQALIPIPGVGAAIGGFVGSVAAPVLAEGGLNLFGLSKGDSAIQLNKLKEQSDELQAAKNIGAIAPEEALAKQTELIEKAQAISKDGDIPNPLGPGTPAFNHVMMEIENAKQAQKLTDTTNPYFSSTIVSPNDQAILNSTPEWTKAAHGTLADAATKRLAAQENLRTALAVLPYQRQLDQIDYLDEFGRRSASSAYDQASQLLSAGTQNIINQITNRGSIWG